MMRLSGARKLRRLDATRKVKRVAWVALGEFVLADR
jgi:hypothetical protein